MSASEPITAEAVSFLSRREAYREPPCELVAIETHMSWVFLADADVYKLKKSIRQDGLDFTSRDLRRRNCLEEVRLNQRLSPGVYLGVVSLTREPHGGLALSGCGPAVDWLVHMRRLPAARNLEVVIREGRAIREAAATGRAARHLATFYRTTARQTPAGFGERLASGVRSDCDFLSQPRYNLSRSRVEVLAASQLAVLRRCAPMFEERVSGGHIVEGHGDLRPEHIWIGEPAIIDCVEFDAALRVVDPADELAFLALECDRLGVPAVGGWFLAAYVEETGDCPPPVVLAFYRVYRAMRRAVIAARHLDDPDVADPARFLARARHYLDMVEPIRADAFCVG